MQALEADSFDMKMLSCCEGAFGKEVGITMLNYQFSLIQPLKFYFYEEEKYRSPSIGQDGLW